MRDREEELLERLSSLAKALPDWLCINRDALLDRLAATVLGSFAATPSPDPREGIETELDFLGLLLADGGDNGLYQMGMDRLDSEIYSAVADLDDDEQVVLLLPLVGDVDDLATDCDTGEWGQCLRKHCVAEWERDLRSIILDRVEPKDCTKD